MLCVLFSIHMKCTFIANYNVFDDDMSLVSVETSL